MKYLPVTIFLILIFGACSRDTSNTTPAVVYGSFQYKVNGNPVVITGNDFSNLEYAIFFKQLAGTIIPHTRYLFNGQKGANHVWVFGIKSDSLSTGNYTYDSTYFGLSGTPSTVIYNGKQSGLIFKGDYMSINVTSYSNGIVSGNFTAKFSPMEAVQNYSIRGTTLITEGKFENIKCIY